MSTEEYSHAEITTAIKTASKQELEELLTSIVGTDAKARETAGFCLLDWLPRRRALTEETVGLLAGGGAEAVARRDAHDLQRAIHGLPVRDVIASNRRAAERLAAARRLAEGRAAAERVVSERRAAAERVVAERRATAERVVAERRAAAERIVAERRAAAERVVAERRALAERAVAERRAAERRASRPAPRQRRRAQSHTGKEKFFPSQASPLIIPGEKKLDFESETWVDWDEECHGYIEMQAEEHPSGFIWTCCDKDGRATHCTMRQSTREWVGGDRTVAMIDSVWIYWDAVEGTSGRICVDVLRRNWRC